MSAFPDPVKAEVLEYLLGTGAPALELRLVSALGTDATAGTEVAATEGYTPPAITFGAADAQNGIANDALVRVNGLPAGDVAGVEVWDPAGPSRRAHAPLVDDGGAPITRSFQAGDAVEFAPGEVVFVITAD